MGKHFKYSLILAGCCLLGCRLLADPIPTLIATSASAGTGACTPNVCSAAISASGDSFTLSGLSLGGTNLNGMPIFFAPYVASFPVSGTVLVGPGAPPYLVTGQFEGAFVDYYGNAAVSAAPFFLGCPSPATTGGCIVSPTITVSAKGGAITAPPITPSSPSTSIIVPATITGRFSACATGALPCTSSSPVVGNTSINLPGQVTVNLSAFYVDIGTTPYVEFLTGAAGFASTPEPTSFLLMTLGLAATSAVILRRKSRKSVIHIAN